MLQRYGRLKLTSCLSINLQVQVSKYKYKYPYLRPESIMNTKSLSMELFSILTPFPSDWHFTIRSIAWMTERHWIRWWIRVYRLDREILKLLDPAVAVVLLTFRIDRHINKQQLGKTTPLAYVIRQSLQTWNDCLARCWIHSSATLQIRNFSLFTAYSVLTALYVA